MPRSKASPYLSGLEQAAYVALESLRGHYGETIPAMAFSKAMDKAYQLQSAHVTESYLKHRLIEMFYDIETIERLANRK